MIVGQTIGPYAIIAKLGEGGMGEVYRARDAALNRDVAIKVLPEAFANDPERLGRFTREAQTLASLSHQNIASSTTGRRSCHPMADGSRIDRMRRVRMRSTCRFTPDGKAGGDRVRISTTGGHEPRFREDGQELFYLSDDGRLMAVSIATHGGTFEASEPKALFMTRTLPRTEQVHWEYDVTRDGQRFLIGTILDGPNAAPPAPTIVLNWR